MKIQILRFSYRRLLIATHDLVVTAAAIFASFYIRFEEAGLVERLPTLFYFLPAFLIYAAAIYQVFHLYQGKWRFASLPDFVNISRAVTVLTISLLVLDYILVSPNVLGTYFFGKVTLVLYWFLQMCFLGGPRVAYRYFRYARTRREATVTGSAPTLILGRAADAEVLLRAVESGAVKKVWPIGILSPSPADQGQSVRGIPILGRTVDIEQAVADLAARNQRIARVVFTPSALDASANPESVVLIAKRLGLAISQLPSLDEERAVPRLAPVNVEDLLLRPSVHIDYQRLEDMVKNKSVVITGGGGSIGSEICDRVVTFGAARVMVIENSEPALHAVLERLNASSSNSALMGHIACVRDRERIFRLLSDFKPDIVFHAAALKHVPLLERDWEEGVKTNIFGSVNVADAAAASGASAMVMISTDKAIEPVSVLGASKRFAEMYCQALDSKLAFSALANTGPMRLISVRFGNVLASNGSVVPKFKAQIEAGGPITVTHPDMVRYFMTIREACDLVITAASHALGDGTSNVEVYVLNMGQPVRIVDLAERMITLSGLEPGRDIDIEFVGIRPGERLNEILFSVDEPVTSVGIEGIVAANCIAPPLETMRNWLETLDQGMTRNDRPTVFDVLRAAVPGFRGGVINSLVYSGQAATDVGFRSDANARQG